jgi:hypothetical protein
MPAKYTCDKCGSTEGASGDLDGEILCSYHQAEKKLYYEEVEYKNQRDWVKRIHLRDLAERRARIAKLKEFIAEQDEAHVKSKG